MASGKRNQLCTQLDLQLGVDGILRVGGRMANARISESAKHPMLLPRHHEFTRLQVWRAHEDCFHFGEKTTLAWLRSKYWVPQGLSYRQEDNQVVSNMPAKRRRTLQTSKDGSTSSRASESWTCLSQCRTRLPGAIADQESDEIAELSLRSGGLPYSPTRLFDVFTWKSSLIAQPKVAFELSSDSLGDEGCLLGW